MKYIALATLLLLLGCFNSAEDVIAIQGVKDDITFLESCISDTEEEIAHCKLEIEKLQHMRSENPSGHELQEIESDIKIWQELTVEANSRLQDFQLKSDEKQKLLKRVQ